MQEEIQKSLLEEKEQFRDHITEKIIEIHLDVI
jgi:hypothetical protein